MIKIGDGAVIAGVFLVDVILENVKFTVSFQINAGVFAIEVNDQNGFEFAFLIWDA